MTSLDELLQSASFPELQNKVSQLKQEMEMQSIEIQHAIDTNFQILNTNFEPLRDLRIAIQKASAEIEAESAQMANIQQKISDEYSTFEQEQGEVIALINKKIDAKKYYVFKDFTELCQGEDIFEIQQLIIDCGDQFQKCEDANLKERNTEALYELIIRNQADLQFLLNIGVDSQQANDLALLHGLKNAEISGYRDILRILQQYDLSALKCVSGAVLRAAELLSPCSQSFPDDYAQLLSLCGGQETTAQQSTRISLSDAGQSIKLRLQQYITESDEAEEPDKSDQNARTDTVLAGKVMAYLQDVIKQNAGSYARELIQNLNSQQPFDQRMIQLYMDIGISGDERERFVFYKHEIWVECEQQMVKFKAEHCDKSALQSWCFQCFMQAVNDQLREFISDSQLLDFYCVLLGAEVFGASSDRFVEKLVGVVAREPTLRQQVAKACQYIIDIDAKLQKEQNAPLKSKVAQYLAAENMQLSDLILEHRADLHAIESGIANINCQDEQQSQGAEQNSLRYRIYGIYQQIIQTYLAGLDSQVPDAQLLACLLVFVVVFSSIHIQRQCSCLAQFMKGFVAERLEKECDLQDVITQFLEFTE